MVHHYDYSPSRTIYRSRPSRTVYVEPSPVYEEPVEVFPQSATDRAFHDGLWAGRIEAATIVGGAALLYNQDHVDDELLDEDEDEDGIRYEDELADTRALMAELKADFAATDRVVSAIQQPASGRYVGETAEDDGGDQGVVTHLTFGADGVVSGWGDDTEDGKYRITAGRWHSDPENPGSTRVAWIEKYEEGFEVALRGQIRNDGVIMSMWASSVGVAGSAELRKDD